MTVEVVVAPDPVATVVAYLSDVLEVPVKGAVPQEKPATFVSVASTGGAGRRDLVLEEATVSIDAWAETDDDAHALARLIEAHMLMARFNTTTIRNAFSYGAPGDFPDPLSGTPRARATYSITLRAAPLP